jgi:putative membrane protein
MVDECGEKIVNNDSKRKHEDLSNPQTPMQYLRLFLTGFAMGASDIVPGVSGGTMAFILGVYETLINAIKSFNLDAIRLGLGFKIKELLEYVSFKFLVALGLGLLTAVVTLSGFLSTTMDDPQGRIFLFAFFFGLVLASILTVGIKVKWSAVPALMFVIGTVVAFIIVNIVPAEGDHSPVFLFVSGMIAITAMILPGISGSFMLLIMGQYDYVLTAVSEKDLPPVIIVGLGAIVGIIAFSRVLSFLLARFYDMTVAALVGFMAGSLWKIYPWKECIETNLDRRDEIRCIAEQNILPDFGSSEFLLALALLVAGFLLVNFLDHLQSKDNPVFRFIWKRA